MFGFTKSRSWLGFNDLWLMLVGMPVVAVLIPVVFHRLYPWNDPHQLVWNFLPTLAYVVIYWLTNRQITIAFRKLMKSPADYAKYLPWQILSIGVATYIICELSCSLIAKLLPMLDNPEKIDFSRTETFIISYITTCLIVLVYEGNYNFNRWKDSLLETERLKKENLRSELEGLRNQVNPHFLFNSLNTLVSIIPEDPDKAVDFVQRLSHIFRYVLDMQERETVSLREEMECVNAYVFLLATRFENNFKADISLNQNELDQHVLPLSVQMLIENAIKHNVVSRNHPLHITIGYEKDKLFVRNNLQPKTSDYSTGKGLDNLKRRYSLLGAGEVEIVADTINYTVYLPVIPNKEYASLDY